MVKFIVAPALVLGLLVGLTVLRAADDAPKYTIKEVMKMAHSGDSSLYKKVAAGKASKDDKQKLVDLYTALAANTPTKGDADSWKEKTTALLDAAKEVQDGKEGAAKDLKKAADCKACHQVHKGK
jgi:hypothetical protein